MFIAWQTFRGICPAELVGTYEGRLIYAILCWAGGAVGLNIEVILKLKNIREAFIFRKLLDLNLTSFGES